MRTLKQELQIREFQNQRDEWQSETRGRRQAEVKSMEKMLEKQDVLKTELAEIKEQMSKAHETIAIMQNIRHKLEAELASARKRFDKANDQLKHERVQAQHNRDKTKQDLMQLHQEYVKMQDEKKRVSEEMERVSKDNTGHQQRGMLLEELSKENDELHWYMNRSLSTLEQGNERGKMLSSKLEDMYKPDSHEPDERRPLPSVASPSIRSRSIMSRNQRYAPTSIAHVHEHLTSNAMYLRVRPFTCIPNHMHTPSQSDPHSLGVGISAHNASVANRKSSRLPRNSGNSNAIKLRSRMVISRAMSAQLHKRHKRKHSQMLQATIHKQGAP